jgi:hypothetical protein
MSLEINNHVIFDPKTLVSENILDVKLITVELNKETELGLDGKDNYIVDFLFENIFKAEDYNKDVEDYFDKIYNLILKETGIYLENIEILDREEIHAWGSIYKDGELYYTYKPASIE